MTEAARRHLSDESIAGMLKDLVFQIGLLFRQEMTLARAEVSRATSRATAALVLLGAGACLAMASLVILLQVAVTGLTATGLPLWLAQIAVGGGAAIVAVVLALSGKSGLSPSEMTPKRTAHSLREMLTWSRSR
jgi:hypothetical protein